LDAVAKRAGEQAMNKKKIYVITFHMEDFRGTYSKRTIRRKSTNVVDLIDEIERCWCKENQRVVIDFIYSETIE
jgi:maltodextrin utilization protein YvdJ